MKKCIPVMLAVLVVVFVYKKTNVGSYVSTAWAHAQKEVKEQVPTRFEIERVRHEIGNLDGDVGNMIRPIAEHMAALATLRKDIQATQADLDREREALLRMTKDLEANPEKIDYDGKLYPAGLIKTKLQRDFDGFKRLEAKLQSQKKLLEAKESSLQSAQEQLAKVIAKKREYEVRLAQLEADEESLQTARLGTPFKLDDSRASQIEAALADIEKRQNVQRAEIVLKSGNFATDGIPVNRNRQTPTDVSAIRRHLETQPALATTTAISKN